jgi:PAS domain S-box-containing protein
MPDGYFQFIIQDITERLKAESALRVSEEKFAKAFQSSPDAITISSIDTTKYIDVNDGFCEMSGYTRAEALGHSADELGIWDNIDHRRELVEILQRDGQIRDYEILLRHKSGTHIDCLVSVEVIEISGQKCLVAITRDVTNKKRIEKEREKLIKELGAKNAELEQFTYTVSHDLKAPIITIKGFLGFLSADALSGNSKRLEVDIRRISEATDKMHNLLDNLLELSRIGRMMNNPEPVAIGELAAEAEEMLQGRLQNRTIQIIVKEPLLKVYGDRQRLMEVIQNLLDNAAKFMGAQSDPKIELGQTDKSEDGFVTLYVRDNGMGIAPQFHERIFGLFNRLHPGLEGTGIGLALVKRIVEFHGGKIWLESELGQGATFFFTLPQAK